MEAEVIGAGLHSLVNAECDKIVGAAAVHVLAVSWRGGVVACLCAAPVDAWVLGDGLLKILTKSRLHLKLEQIKTILSFSKLNA